MTFTELIPSLEKLSYQDKLKAIQFLANQLAEEDRTRFPLENGKTYEVWSPYDAFSAETILTQMLNEYSQNGNESRKELPRIPEIETPC